MTILIKTHKFDFILISETHLNNSKTYKLKGYDIYNTNHPEGQSHGGKAVIIRNNLKHYLHNKIEEKYLQATTVTVMNCKGT